MSAENVSLALKVLRDGKRSRCPWCQSPMADVRMAEEDGETYGHATWMCGYGINWVVGDLEHDQCTIKLAEYDGKMRMCWEWELSALRAEVKRLTEDNERLLEAINAQWRKDCLRVAEPWKEDAHE